MEEKIRRQNATLEGINQILLEALNSKSEAELGGKCLAILEEVTQSQFGFIGEISSQGKLDNIAISHSGQAVCEIADVGGHSGGPMEVKIHGIYGRVLLDGKGFFTNDPAAHPGSVGLPAGHPPLAAFLGVPLTHNGKTIGMVGLANRQDGYREADLQAAVAMSHAIVQVLIHMRGQNALHESREKYRRLFNAIDEGFCIIEKVAAADGEPLDFRYIEANPAFAVHAGVGDVYGKTIRQVFPAESEKRFAIYDTVLTTGESIRFEDTLAANGRQLELYAFRVEDNSKRRLAVVFRDISERKHLEEIQLRQSEDRFRKLFDDSPAMIVIIRMADDKYVEVNGKFLQIMGFAKEEVLGRTPMELGIRAIDDSVLVPILARLNETGEIQNAEFDMRTKTGGSVTVLASIAVATFNGEPCRLVSMQDITKEKLLEADILRLDRLNLVGEMAASIGHEVRNPLTTVRGYLQMFQRKKESSHYREQFATMIGELDRANTIISGFLSLAKNKALELKHYNLNDVISAMLPLLQSEALRTGHDIEVDMGNVPDIKIDESAIRQLLLNLACNAFEAMAAGGKLTIGTGEENGKVVLVVRDTGRGIPQEVLGKLGTPFITTKENGTGLGLPVCYRIAERHNATIDVNTSSQGTTFIISFDK